MSSVIFVMSCNKDLLDVDHRTHDNWVVCLSRHEAAEVYLTEELRHAESNPMCKIHESRCTSRTHSRLKSFARFFCPGESHQRSSNAPKFQDRFQEETEWQEQGAREAAWTLAKSVLKLKEQNKAAFFSPSENRCLPASTLKPEEREFVVDSGASVHMISKKGLEFCWNGYLDEVV